MVVLRGTKGESMKVLIKIEVGSTGQDKFADVDFDTQLDASERGGDGDQHAVFGRAYR